MPRTSFIATSTFPFRSRAPGIARVIDASCAQAPNSLRSICEILNSYQRDALRAAAKPCGARTVETRLEGTVRAAVTSNNHAPGISADDDVERPAARGRPFPPSIEPGPGECVTAPQQQQQQPQMAMAPAVDPPAPAGEQPRRARPAIRRTAARVEARRPSPTTSRPAWATRADRFGARTGGDDRVAAQPGAAGPTAGHDRQDLPRRRVHDPRARGGARPRAGSGTRLYKLPVNSAFPTTGRRSTSQGRPGEAVDGPARAGVGDAARRPPRAPYAPATTPSRRCGELAANPLLPFEADAVGRALWKDNFPSANAVARRWGRSRASAKARPSPLGLGPRTPPRPTPPASPPATPPPCASSASRRGTRRS